MWPACAQGQLFHSTAIGLALKGKSWRTPCWDLPPSSSGGIASSQTLCQSCADLNPHPNPQADSPPGPQTGLGRCRTCVLIQSLSLLLLCSRLPLAGTVLGRAVPSLCRCQIGSILPVPAQRPAPQQRARWGS